MNHFLIDSIRNRNLWIIFPGLLAGLALSSCATMQSAVPARSDITIPKIDSTRALEPSKAESFNVREAVSVTLEGAIETALLNNPRLQAIYARFEGLSLRNPQVSSLPDPKINYSQFVEGVQTRTGEQEFIIGVSQTLPWFGELRLQGEIADRKARQALEEYRLAMLDIRKQVSEAVYRLNYEKAAMELAEEDRATLEQSLEVASALYATAQRSREAVLKAQTELARVENELTGYPARIAALESELSSLLHDDRRIDILDSFPETDRWLSGIGLNALIEAAKQERPEMRHIELDREIADLEYELARKDDYPDVTLGVNYIGIGNSPTNPVDEGDDAWNIGIGINIPIPNARRKAAKRIAHTMQAEAEYRKLAQEDQIEKEIASILPELEALQQQQSILQTNLIPLAQETFEAGRISYESGRASFLDLLDAQRTYIKVRADLLKVQRDHRLAAVRLERAIGGVIADPRNEEEPS
ncbi:MAG: TolC family protein [Candidatus Omnitrophica bacterium]|nr:TolC family protein [Candidatus Omnitrophota bacterium]